MILWSGDEMHEGQSVPEKERCVGCDENRADASGWCAECYAEVVAR